MGSSTYSEMIFGSVVILSVRTLGGAVTLSSTILGSLVITYSLPTI